MVWESGAPIIYQALTSVRGRYVIFKYIQLTYKKKKTPMNILSSLYIINPNFIYIFTSKIHIPVAFFNCLCLQEDRVVHTVVRPMK